MKESIRGSRSYFKYTFLVFLGLFLISFLTLFFIESKIKKAKVEEFQINELRVVEMERKFLDREFTMLLGDIHYLQHTFKDELIEQKYIESVSNQWVNFSTEKKIYDQIRYIDVYGNEIIRINYDNAGSYNVPRSKLQNKANRYYFKEALKLSENDVYISPLDLNIESGAVEVPYKPMIRLAVVIKNKWGETKGTIVLNYMAGRTLDSFRDISENSEGEIFLINDRGYSLSSANKENDWNFMFEDKKSKSFSGEFSEEWEKIGSGNTQFATNKGLFTSELSDFEKSLSLFNSRNNIKSSEKWYIVSYVERNEVNSHIFNDNTLETAQYVLVKNALYLVIIVIVSGIIGFMMFVNRVAYSKIKYHSEYDSFTKTYNRRAGMERLNQLFAIDDRRNMLICLCFIDINGLKAVNDNLGHKYGDELIIAVANGIKKSIRADDFIIRLGGDEFLIVFNGIDIGIAENVWGRIVNEFDNINENESRPYVISVSHGIVCSSNNEKNYLDKLLSEADYKMYAEKEIIKRDLKVIR